MKLVEIHKYKFPSHLLAPLINGDPVDEIDRDHFNAFLDELEKYKKEYNATDCIIEYGKDSYFAKSNCLSDVGCEVTEIRVHFIR